MPEQDPGRHIEIVADLIEAAVAAELDTLDVRHVAYLSRVSRDDLETALTFAVLSLAAAASVAAGDPAAQTASRADFARHLHTLARERRNAEHWQQRQAAEEEGGQG